MNDIEKTDNPSLFLINHKEKDAAGLYDDLIKIAEKEMPEIFDVIDLYNELIKIYDDVNCIIQTYSLLTAPQFIVTNSNKTRLNEYTCSTSTADIA